MVANPRRNVFVTRDEHDHVVNDLELPMHLIRRQSVVELRLDTYDQRLLTSLELQLNVDEFNAFTANERHSVDVIIADAFSQQFDEASRVVSNLRSKRSSDHWLSRVDRRTHHVRESASSRS